MRPAALIAVVLLLAGGRVAAQQTETISFESRQKGQPVEVSATIYWPAVPGPVPALVLHHGSGGVSEQREGRYAREMTAMGVAAVVIDSFRPRGITSTVHDQFAVTSEDFNLDALRALQALAGDSRIDSSRIGIAGFSKGGISALMAAHEQLAVESGLPDGLRYALHVPFYPACVTQYYRPRITGAPIYMLLGGADTYVGVEPCQTYGEALRKAGARVEVKVYPDAPHGFDGGRAWTIGGGENYSQCVVQQQADGSWVERTSGVAIAGAGGRPIGGAVAKALSACRTLGVSGGGNAAARKQSMDDLKSYVRRHLQGG